MGIVQKDGHVRYPLFTYADALRTHAGGKAARGLHAVMAIIRQWSKVHLADSEAAGATHIVDVSVDATVEIEGRGMCLCSPKSARSEFLLRLE